MSTFMVLAFALLALLFSNLERTYRFVSISELQKYSGREYIGKSTRFLLWAASAVLAAVSFALAFNIFPSWLASIFAAITMILVFVYIPNSQPSKISRSASLVLLPYVLKCVDILKPLSDKLSWLVKNQDNKIQTNLVYKKDLVSLLEQQKLAENNKIELWEIDLLLSLAGFGDKKIKDYMTPRGKIKPVGLGEKIGPIFIDELYKTGFSHFPIWGDKKSEILGVLKLSDAVEQKEEATVEEILSHEFFYINKMQTLEDATKAFIDTKQHLLWVVDKSENVVGLITLGDVLRQIFSDKLASNFMHYDDIHAMAEVQISQEDKK